MLRKVLYGTAKQITLKNKQTCYNENVQRIYERQTVREKEGEKQTCLHLLWPPITDQYTMANFLPVCV